MLKSNKLTSDSIITTNRPTSRIDSSYLNRGTSQHTQRQSSNKKYWIQINKDHQDIIDTQPYITIEKYRKTNSCHIRPSLNRKTSSEIKNKIDLNEIKHFIQNIDNNYEDEPFRRKENQQQIFQYQNEKRLNHLNLIITQLREGIQNRNISNEIVSQNQQKFNNKIKIRQKEISIIKQKSDKDIGFKLSQLKQQNTQPQQIYNNYLQSFRASSDQILNQIPLLPSQQIFKLTERLGNLENYNLNSERIYNHKIFCGRPQQSIKKILKRNNNYPDQLDNQLFMDESIISETEAKLNSLYGESICIQKNLIQNQQSNPIKVIQQIKKMDEIKCIINNVNANKLMNKFII